MTVNLGDFLLGSTIDHKFTVVDSTGLPTTLSGSPVISAYPGNSATELTAGITLSVDFDSRTGLNHIRIVASTGNGYAAGNDYHLVITVGTVGGVSVVGYDVGMFSLDNRVFRANLITWLGTAVTLSSGVPDVNIKTITAAIIAAGSFASGALDAVWSTAARTLTAFGFSVTVGTNNDKGGYSLSQAFPANFSSLAISAGGVVNAAMVAILGTTLTETAGQLAAGFKQFFNIASPTSTMNEITLVDTITTYTGNTKQTGDAFLRLGTPAGASTAADVAAIKALLPTALVGGRMDSSVGAMANSVLTTAAIAAGAFDPTVFSTTAEQAFADALLDRANAVETGLTFRQWLRLSGAVLLGKASGLDTNSPIYRNAVADAKARVSATTDAFGNRSAVTTDAT